MAKKRANGEGSIRKKPSGRWEGRYTQGIDPVTGRAIQKSVSAKTQAECKEKLAKAIRENRGVPLNHTGDYTAAEWCRLWFETYSKPNIRYNTAKGYEGIIEHHIIPAIGAIKLKQLSSIHIQRMYNDLKENGRMQRGSKQNDKPLSNTFVRRVHAVLQAALKQAVKERLIPYNPCENCRIPPKDKKEMTILPPEKIGRYLKEAEKYGVLPMFYLELSSGLRRGELLALQWTDLNVKERILTVNKQVTRMEGELDVTEPKTKNSVRKVALSQQAVDLLVQEHEQHPDNPILFPSPRTGGYWSPDAVSRINRKLLKNAGIEEHVRFHDLRHPYVKHTTKIFSLRLMDFQAQAYNSFERLPPPMPISISSIVCSGSFLFLEKSFPGTFTHASKFAAVFFIAWNNADRTRSGYDFLFTWKASLKNVIIFKAKPSIFIDLSSVFLRNIVFICPPALK